jgi:VanZ family protein
MLRTLATISWVMMILLFTCTESMEHLINQRIISFQLNTNPNFSEFLYPLPTTFDIQFLLRKMGHAISFLILTFFLYLNHLSKKVIFILNFCLATLTEALQLFLHRGGRLFDIGFDVIGCMIGLIVITSLQILLPKHLTKESKKSLFK